MDISEGEAQTYSRRLQLSGLECTGAEKLLQTTYSWWGPL